MNAEDDIQKEEPEESVHSIIQKIKDGLLSIKNVGEEDRLECVDTLRFEGCTVSQIAQALKLSERTIKRYVAILKDSHALAVDENFQRQLLGDITQRVLNSSSYLIRLSRNKDTSTQDKIHGEQAACSLLFDLVKLLQSTGDFSLRPQMIDADIHHHVHNLTEKDIIDIEAAAKETIGLPDNLKKLLGDLRSEAQNPPQTDPKEKPNDTEQTE